MIKRILTSVALLALALPSTARADLDVVFALDTTGSMGRELDEAKDRVQQIAGALREARAQERIRFGVVAFRDKGDDYVTKNLELTSDIARVKRFIAGLSAGGGGDGPEHVLAALEVAIKRTSWGDGERQVFVVGDAPPHFDYDGVTIDELTKEARAKRIVINTIGCRSLPQNGIYAFRSMAYETEGAYQHIGRVAVGQEDKGLADAVLRSLGGGDEAVGPTTPVEIVKTEREGSRGMHLEVTPVVDGPNVCAVDLELPGGMALRRQPTIRQGKKLHVDLGTPVARRGDARRIRYTIEPCVPATLPLSVEIGG